MSDISIPGISGGNSRIDTGKLIEDLVTVERIPINRLEGDIEEMQLRQTVWRDLNRSISTLLDSAKKLYSFQNPFASRVAQSSQSDAIEATASRLAEEQVTSIAVQSIAHRDRFASSPIAADRVVPSGRYGFRVGDRETSFNFPGGSLREFATAATTAADGIVALRVINHSDGVSVLLVESQQTGTANRLEFLDDARGLAIDVGIIREKPDSVHRIATDRTALTPWTRPLDFGAIVPGDDLLEIAPGGEASLPLQAPVAVDEGLVLSFEARVVNTLSAKPAIVGPNIPPSGSVTLESVTVHNEPSQDILPDPKSFEPIVVNDPQFLFAAIGEAVRPLPPLADSEGFVPMQIPLADFVAQIDALNVRNQNSHRVLSLRNINIYDPTVLSGAEPLNPIQQAADARLSIDGISVTRSDNTIDDLVSGVTLNLRSPTNGEATLTVTPDYDAIQVSILEFLAGYNQLLRDVNILTRNDGGVIDEIVYFDEEEQQRAQQRLGLMIGETTLNQLKHRLQTIMMNPYPTSVGRTVGLLSQIGISTNAAGPNTSGVDPSRLRGYLEMDEEQFAIAIRQYLQPIKELFGNDNDGDFAIDSGVAYEVARYSQVYSQTGGIIPIRESGFDTRIQNAQTRIETYTSRLERYEQNLREEFGRMEGALNALEDSTQSLQNLNNTGN